MKIKKIIKEKQFNKNKKEYYLYWGTKLRKKWNYKPEIVQNCEGESDFQLNWEGESDSEKKRVIGREREWEMEFREGCGLSSSDWKRPLNWELWERDVRDCDCDFVFFFFLL